MLDRRDVLKFGALGLAATVAAHASAQIAPAKRAAARDPAPQPAGKPRPAEAPLDLLILGGTGLTGPHQVRYALARGHRVTLFNRGRKQPEWPGEVQQLLGDRDRNDYASIEAEIARGRR